MAAGSCGGAPVGLPGRRPDCVRARVRAAAAPARPLVGPDGGPRADGQRQYESVRVRRGRGEHSSRAAASTGRRSCAGGTSSGRVAGPPLARARRGAPRAQRLGTAADPVLGRSMYPSALSAAGKRARDKKKRVFSSHCEFDN